VSEFHHSAHFFPEKSSIFSTFSSRKFMKGDEIPSKSAGKPTTSRFPSKFPARSSVQSRAKNHHQ
jgi:hypothetical protein